MSVFIRIFASDAPRELAGRVNGFCTNLSLWYIPKPRRLFYSWWIKARWKGALKFEQVELGVDVVIVLNEWKHDQFKRKK